MIVIGKSIYGTALRGMVIRATKLNVLRPDGTAEYHRNGIAYICIKRKGRWFVSDEYFYL